MNKARLALATIAVALVCHATVALAFPQPMTYAALPEAVKRSIRDVAPDARPGDMTVARSDDGSFRIIYIEGDRQHQLMIAASGEIVQAEERKLR